MEKLMKNWIFNLVVSILLAMLTAVLLLGGFNVLPLTNLLHLLVAVILVFYVCLALFPMIIHRTGLCRIFALIEVVLVGLLTASQIGMQFAEIPLISKLQVCSVLGIAVWARAATEILCICAKDDGGKYRLLKVFGYILLASLGCWQVAKPLIEDKVFLFLLAAVALVCTAVFVMFTVQTRGKKSEKKNGNAPAESAGSEGQEAVAEEKKEEAVEEQKELPAAPKIPALPAAKEEKDS